MKNSNRLFFSLVLVVPLIADAQTSTDALRYSQTSTAGTARFTSMGGAFGALGGDFSALSWNPAGIAIYRKSEFTFTPSLYLNNTTSAFMNNSISSNKYNFNFGNLGFVYTRMLSQNDDPTGWKNWNFGIGINRMNNFHSSTVYQGINPNNSMLDYFVEHANGTTPENLDPFYENLPYWTYLINPDTLNPVPNSYNSAIPYGGELQRRTSVTKGAITELVFSFGANYGNKLYFGGTVGFDFLRYVEKTKYEESDPFQNIPTDFNGFSFNQSLTTIGAGINLKLGMIYRASDWARVGFAFHTPTFYSMTDDYSNSMESSFDNGDHYTKDSPQGAYDYNLTTPMRAIGSIAFIIGKMGLVSADYEFVDYSAASFDASDNSFFDANDAIQKKYTTAGNLKIGTEWRYENFSFRGGYAMYGTPLSAPFQVSGSDMSRNCYSLGLGIRDQDYFIDFGYVLSQGTDYFYPYTLSYPQKVPVVQNKVNTHNFTVTFGIKF